jgi:hypothetical protein
VHDQLTSASEQRKEALAAEAAERIKRGQHWLDWMYIAEGLEVGRNKAMRRAGTNRPMGSAYNKAFGQWLDEHRWARDLDKPTRIHLLWCIDHRNDIEAWRETLAQNERARLDHPTAMKRRYEATHKLDGAKDDGSAKGVHETRTQRLERELEAVITENDALKRRLGVEGSLFDLKRDTVKHIAETIAGNVTYGRLVSIQKAIAQEIARLKAEQKHAG